MASEPKTKANGTNWEVAFAYYRGLPPHRRTKAAVARRFNVSDARVGQIARKDGWDEGARKADERVRARVVTLGVRSRADRLARTIEVSDLVQDYAHLKLTAVNGALDVDAADKAGLTLDAALLRIPALFKMAELAAGEATDRVSIADVQPVLVAFARIAVLQSPADVRGETMRLLDAASSGLVALGPGEA